MRKTLPIVWDFHGRIHTGKFEAVKERIELSSRGHTLTFRRDAVTGYVVERGAETRIRGLPAITIRLEGGEVVRVASLGGAGSLHEVAGFLATPEDNRAARHQGLAGAGT